ncbi:MAG TPA: aminoglycoside phosphotransferase family protein [Candidatus Limnocylindrales bacterium]
MTELFIKVFQAWDRGEHIREWDMLQHLHRHLPDLVPRPVSASLDAVPPTVTMTVLPGTPLSGPLSPAQADALVAAITRLWTVPCDEPWNDGDLAFARRLTDGQRPSAGVTAEAYDAALAWWDGPDPVLLSTEPSRVVLGHGDPYLANYLWDGTIVRLVDFEDARPSDPAAEVAILAEHLSTRDSPTLPTLFDVDPVRLLAARRLWAMFWLRRLLPGGPSADRNPPGTADLQARRLLHLLTATATA